ncbi:hypothetical protein [Flavivirga jejuensis]|uniref:Uncharacterized protein n=1 Tax=Flavivirga jejuensis TaxID=870487 RepID=A0ABT8WNL4_9FLAO|nr:hypothetical protein [Flavivirga jejuensis]MDO5974764.1 hypothetical protein [Flavivirga jejuensis]
MEFVRLSSGKANETRVYDAHSKLSSKIKTYYDENNHNVKTLFFDSNESLTMESIRENNSDGNCIKLSIYHAKDRKLVSQTLNTYDSNGNLIEDEIWSHLIQQLNKS